MRTKPKDLSKRLRDLKTRNSWIIQPLKRNIHYPAQFHEEMIKAYYSYNTAWMRINTALDNHRKKLTQ